MGIMGYIKEKKALFEAKRSASLARRVQEAEVKQYKAEIEIAQRQKLADAQKTEEKLRDMKRGSGFTTKYMNTVRANNTKNIGQPSLFAQNNMDSGYKGMNFGEVGEYNGPFNKAKKAKQKATGWNPAGDYRGPFK